MKLGRPPRWLVHCVQVLEVARRSFATPLSIPLVLEKADASLARLFCHWPVWRWQIPALPLQRRSSRTQHEPSSLREDSARDLHTEFGSCTTVPFRDTHRCLCHDVETFELRAEHIWVIALLDQETCLLIRHDVDGFQIISKL